MNGPLIKRPLVEIYNTIFKKSHSSTLRSLIQGNCILLDTPKNVPIFFTMQIESNSLQPFFPLFRLLQLNERDAKQKKRDEIISR